MNTRRVTTILISSALPFILLGPIDAIARSEIKGGAILDHACGKVAVKQMSLVHAGKMDEAQTLSTKEMHGQWKALPATERARMAGMAKEMSQPTEQYTADIKAHGILVVDGQAAELTIETKTKDANVTSSSTLTQNFKVTGSECLVSR